MAKDDKKNHEEATKNTAPETTNTANAVPEFDMSQADGLANFAARIPQYNPGIDARQKANLGKKGPPIHGYMLGLVELPSTISDSRTGEVRPWIGIVIELLQPCPVREGKAENPTFRTAVKGERILLTQSTAFERFSKAAENREQVYECLIVPQVGKTKNGQSLWEFPEVRFGRPKKRTDQHLVGIADLLPEEVAHPALPMHASAAS